MSDNGQFFIIKDEQKVFPEELSSLAIFQHVRLSGDALIEAQQEFAATHQMYTAHLES